MDHVKRFLEVLFPNPAYQVPALLFALAIVVLVLIAVFSKKAKAKGYRANLALGVVISSLLEMVMLVDFRHRWQWIVGLLPTLLVGYQAFFLWLYHPRDPRETGTGDGNKGVELSGGTGSGGQATRQQDQLRKVGYVRALASMNNHFGITTLFVRYGLPAVLLGITGIIMLDILSEPGRFFSVIRVIDDQIVADENVKKILLGIRLGAVGAYVYVLLELGRRTFRHDVTGASAMWCLVTLVLGPVLAATVAILWRMDGPASDGWWGSGVVLFFAGFAPRRVIAAVEQAAVQLLKVGSQNVVVESRLISLGKIRGISPQIEERLSEEGIIDVNSLAAAEPVRLVRNTSFDMKQILNWIDEAILIATLPKSWEAFEDEGITGAIDLAWFYDQLFDADGKPIAIPPQISDLAAKGKIAPANLVSTIQRLYEDSQVQYIWALYNNFTEYSGKDRTDEQTQTQSTLNSGKGVLP